MKKIKGFTLIELLVVIAIIGILASVVLASLNKARDKGQDAKIKAQLDGAKNAAQVYFDTNSDYGTATDLCDNMFVDNPSSMDAYSNLANYPSAMASLTCRSTGTAFAISASLISVSEFWCIDSAGSAQQNASDLALGDDTCN